MANQFFKRLENSLRIRKFTISIWYYTLMTSILVVPSQCRAMANLCHGGRRAVDSVLNGLRLVKEEWVLVHDAARPCDA